MIRWNLFFEVEKVEQLALIDRLATHHDRPPSLKASGKRNHDSSISTRPFSTGSVRLGHSVVSVQCPVCPKADMAERRATPHSAGPHRPMDRAQGGNGACSLLCARWRRSCTAHKTRKGRGDNPRGLSRVTFRRVNDGGTKPMEPLFRVGCKRPARDRSPRQWLHARMQSSRAFLSAFDPNMLSLVLMCLSCVMMTLNRGVAPIICAVMQAPFSGSMLARSQMIRSSVCS